MSRTITIDDKLYYIEQRNYTKNHDPLRTINRGITGLTIVQIFDEADSLKIKLLCYREGYAPSGYGDNADLLIAHGKMPVIIPDLINGHEEWVWTSPLSIKWEWAIADPEAPFLVDVSLDKYYGVIGGGGP